MKYIILIFTLFFIASGEIVHGYYKKDGTWVNGYIKNGGHHGYKKKHLKK